MADEAEPTGMTMEPDDIDPGEPVAALAELRQNPTEGFLATIRRRIQRRHLAADAADLSLSGFAFVALEWLTVAFQYFQPNRHREGD